MTGKVNGVAPRFRRLSAFSAKLNVHSFCNRIALGCSDIGNKLEFIQDFELTMIRLLQIFKNSSKLLKIYKNVATLRRNLGKLS